MEFIRKAIKWYKRPNKSTFVQYVEAFIIILPIAFVIRTYLYGLYVVPSGSMEPTMLVGERFLADKLTIWFSPPKRGDIISFNDPNFDYSKNPFFRLVQEYVWLHNFGPANWTKRVVAIPGDHIKGVVEDGKPEVYLNGKKLDEKYTNPYGIKAMKRPSENMVRRTYVSKLPLDEQPFYRFTPYEVIAGKRMAKALGQADVLQPHTPIPSYLSGSDVFEYKLEDDQYFCMGDNRLGSHDSRAWGPLRAKQIHGKIIFRLTSQDSTESFWILDLLKHPIDFWKRMRWGRFFQKLK